ncbi:MAG: Spy/CpxP family protein refolding chaperone [Caulobacteraceae bacterium]
MWKPLVAAMLIAGAAAAQPAPSRLHDALALTPAQEAGWAAYTSSAAADAGRADRVSEARSMLPTLPTPRRLALVRAMMAADMAAFDQNARAVVAFYRGLTPEQQRIFDARTAPPADASGR